MVSLWEVDGKTMAYLSKISATIRRVAQSKRASFRFLWWLAHDGADKLYAAMETLVLEFVRDHTVPVCYTSNVFSQIYDLCSQLRLSIRVGDTSRHLMNTDLPLQGEYQQSFLIITDTALSEAEAFHFFREKGCRPATPLEVLTWMQVKNKLAPKGGIICLGNYQDEVVICIKDGQVYTIGRIKTNQRYDEDVMFVGVYL